MFAAILVIMIIGACVIFAPVLIDLIGFLLKVAWGFFIVGLAIVLIGALVCAASVAVLYKRTERSGPVVILEEGPADAGPVVKRQKHRI